MQAPHGRSGRSLLLLLLLTAALAPRRCTSQQQQEQQQQPQRLTLTDTFDGPDLNTTIWGGMATGDPDSNLYYTGLITASDINTTCGAQILGSGAFNLNFTQGSYGDSYSYLYGFTYHQLQPFTLPPNATWSVQAMRTCTDVGDVVLSLEYSDDQEASWHEAWSATDLPVGELKQYTWTMPPETTNKTVLTRFRGSVANLPNNTEVLPSVVLDNLTLDVLWPTQPAALLPLPRPGTTIIRDDFNQSGPIPPSEVPPTEGQLNSSIWTGFRQWTAGAYNWSACATQQYGGTDSYVLMINTMAWVQMQPFTFPSNATISFYAIACGSSDEVPLSVSYANEDEQPWQEAWSVAPVHDEWRRYEFKLPFAYDTYASLRWGKPTRDQTVGVYVDRLAFEVVWPQPAPPRPSYLPAPTDHTAILYDNFDQPTLNSTIWSDVYNGTARLRQNDNDTYGLAVYGSGAFVLGPGSFRQLQPLTFPANSSWTVFQMWAFMSHPAFLGPETSLHLDYSLDGGGTWQAAWSTRPSVGTWHRDTFKLPFERETTAVMRFRRPDDGSQWNVVLDKLSMEVVWPQPPVPPEFRP